MHGLQYRPHRTSQKKIDADRFYLAKESKESKQGLLYLDELTRRITRLIPSEELKILECPIWNIPETMPLPCELVRREKSAGNFVYINILITGYDSDEQSKGTSNRRHRQCEKGSQNAEKVGNRKNKRERYKIWWKETYTHNGGTEEHFGII